MDFLLFVGLGHRLSKPEISARLPQAAPINPGLYSFTADSPNQAITIVSQLGSSLKLAQKIKSWDNQPQTISSLIKTPNYSVSFLPQDLSQTKNLSLQIKKILGSKYRYLLPQQDWGLSPLIIKKQALSEFFLFSDQVFQTIWAHDPHHWILKDRNLPHADAKIGLIPPKIARILVNFSGIIPSSNKTLLDPFCGSGRILVEAIELGFQAIGADISPSQIKGCQQNLNALQIEPNRYQLLQSDATNLNKHLSPASIDLIVTEPFMGRPNPQDKQIPNLIKGLKKLYLGSLKHWLPLLKDKAKVVMVFPQVISSLATYSTSSVVDDPALVSYNVKARNIIYSRPKARTKRQILILQKNKSK